MSALTTTTPGSAADRVKRQRSETATGPPDPVCSYELSSPGPGWRAILSRKVTSALARPAQVAADLHASGVSRCCRGRRAEVTDMVRPARSWAGSTGAHL